MCIPYVMSDLEGILLFCSNLFKAKERRFTAWSLRMFSDQECYISFFVFVFLYLFWVKSMVHE